MAKSIKAQTTRLNSLFLHLQPALAVSLIILGATLIFWSSQGLFGGFLQSEHKSASAVSPVPVQKKTKIAKIYIPKIEKTLDVSDGVVVDNRWTISATGVSYLVTSATPGTFGNAVLYGHNLKSVLGDLPRIREGDLIYLVMDDGPLYKYQVFERREVTPGAVEILKNTTDARLTVYTCTGFLDNARFVVVAKLVSS